MKCKVIKCQEEAETKGYCDNCWRCVNRLNGTVPDDEWFGEDYD